MKTKISLFLFILLLIFSFSMQISKAADVPGCCYDTSSPLSPCKMVKDILSCSGTQYVNATSCDPCFKEYAGCCIKPTTNTCQDNVFQNSCPSGWKYEKGKKCSEISECIAKSNVNTEKKESGVTGPPSGEGGGISGPTENSRDVIFTNPLKYKTVNEFATNVLGTLRSIIVVLSIIFIVLGGIFYITSAGNEKRMTAAKGAITASMIGLAVGIAAPSFLKEIYTIMGGDSSDIDKTSISGSLTLTQISLNFLDFLLAIVGVLALIMMIVGGIMYLTSAGDDDRIKTAKKIVTYSIIGIAVSLASLVVVKQIAKLLT